MKNEQQTRIELIDRLLQQASWNVKDPTQVVEEFDILVDLSEGVQEARTPYEGHQFSDYVLLGKDGRPLAVIEAKKTSRDAAIGREQAMQYCYAINTVYCKRRCERNCCCDHGWFGLIDINLNDKQSDFSE